MGLNCFWYEDEWGHQITDAHVSAIVDHREDINGKDVKIHVAACGAEGAPQNDTQPYKRWVASIHRTKHLKKHCAVHANQSSNKKQKQQDYDVYLKTPRASSYSRILINNSQIERSIRHISFANLAIAKLKNLLKN
ncbi:MAG: hypothetical protein CMI52_04500 [Parcubacteria group bacterium]|nr:hypothetical protein [Parcubacteria group bacterium]|tara:strand:+ start:677 stop:1084 length:408 start_codon:yes stop_codon:yes gene_type:complete